MTSIHYGPGIVPHPQPVKDFSQPAWGSYGRFTMHTGYAAKDGISERMAAADAKWQDEWAEVCYGGMLAVLNEGTT